MIRKQHLPVFVTFLTYVFGTSRLFFFTKFIHHYITVHEIRYESNDPHNDKEG